VQVVGLAALGEQVQDRRVFVGELVEDGGSAWNGHGMLSFGKREPWDRKP
jgi:hypothetical protein